MIFSVPGAKVRPKSPKRMRIASVAWPFRQVIEKAEGYARKISQPVRSRLVNAQADAQRLSFEGAETWGAKTTQCRRSAPATKVTVAWSSSSSSGS